MRFLLGAIASILLGCSVPAAAALIDVAFTGTVTSPQLQNAVFSGSFAFDSNTLPTNTSSLSGGTVGFYNIVTDLSLHLTPASPGASTIDVFRPSQSLSLIFGDNINGIDRLSIGGFGSADFTAPSNAISAVVPIPTTFGGPVSGSFSVSSGTGFTGNYSGTLTSLTFTAPSVPEPATWLTMIVGMGLIGSALRRQQRLTTGGVALAQA